MSLCFSYIVLSYDFHILCFSYTVLFHMFVVYYAFRILYFSYGFPFFTFMLVLLYTLIFYLSYTLCFRILSLLFLCSYTYFHINLYCTTCSCNCLYFHRIAVLCFSYRVISYTLHLRFHSDYRIGIHDRFDRESRHVCHSVAM